MKNFCRLLNELDLFGCEIKWRIDGDQKFKSKFGSFISLCLFAFLTYSFYLFILEMNEGKNASLNSKDALLQENQGLTFGPTDFLFSVGIVDTYGNYIQNDMNKIFSVIFYYCEQVELKTNCDFIPSVPCDTIGQSFSDEVTQRNSYCLSPEYMEKRQNITLQGSMRMRNFSILGSLIKFCENTTDFLYCAPKEEINQQLASSNLFYTYTSYSFNKELEGNPYSKFQNTETAILYSQTTKHVKVQQKFSQATANINPFYFFPSEQQYSAIEYDKSIYDTQYNNGNSNLLAEIMIQLTHKRQIYYIQYQTLMDVLAKVGGLYTILKMILDFIVLPIQQLLLNFYLIKTLEQFKCSMNDNTKKRQSNSISVINLIKDKKIRQQYQDERQQIQKTLSIDEILHMQLKLEKLQKLIKYKSNCPTDQIKELMEESPSPHSQTPILSIQVQKMENLPLNSSPK
ncbi:unnamed protein product (macronuclear) [Paramecium tetraurelia]|uniref:Transmembrane protein n=1 Tax=Paramecium tetraurelia TaxID=5888 RepID=A0CYP4_PARTE|nr:uncharacterized protein GSPATT00011512001 [Paramecium tetraurelia]CAK75911.1 unnamed protein product [Paramecium tetraurelia]|eukprot:XP_001443308.1 hypothetical protein (macronuclear) [Paramecium tetraurelia strain d4-2]